MSSLYTAGPNDTGVALNKFADPSLPSGYTAMVPVDVGGKKVLFAYNGETQKTDVYSLTDSAPWVELSSSKVDLKCPVKQDPVTKTSVPAPWDSLNAFKLGNLSYIMAYERDTGTFSFFQVSNGFYRPTDELSVSDPYTFAYIRNTPTQGFTSVGVYTSLNQVTFTGYAEETGVVANFSLSVTPKSEGSVPPLLALNVWYHQWAKHWKRFAFFQLGGANFFFKINTGKLNVNIDHMQDDPSKGSVEVGSYLQDKLPDALAITNAAIIPWADGEPYLLTYISETGAAKVYRIHSNCKGWTQKAAATVEKGATQTITYRIGAQSYVLVY